MAFETVGVRAVIEGLQAFEAAARKIRKEIEDVGKSGKLTEREIAKLSQTLRNIGLAFTAASAAGGAFLYSATRLAARVETLGVVTTTLGKNAGKTEDEIRALEQAVKDEGITLRGTRQAIALMLQAQIDLSHATKLATMAQNAAVIANVNSTEAFERLVFVITSGNVRMARTLGLQVSFQRAYKEAAAAIGKTVEELTEQEKVQARTNAVLAAGTQITDAYANAMETAGKQVLSLDRHIEESRRILGEAFLPIFADVVAKVTEGLEKFEKLDVTQQRQISTLLGMATAWSGAIGVLALGLSAVLKLKGALMGLGLIVKVGLGPISAFVGLIAAATTGMALHNARLVEARRQYKLTTDGLMGVGVSYEAYVNGVEKAAKANNLITVSQEEYNRLLEGGQRATLTLANAVVILTEEERKLQQQTAETAEHNEWLMDSYKSLTPAIEGARAKTESLTSTMYYQMAAEAIIAGNYKAAEHFLSLARAAEEAEEDIQAVIDALMAADGTVAYTDIWIRTHRATYELGVIGTGQVTPKPKETGAERTAKGEKVWDSRSGAKGGWWYHNFATGRWSRTKNYQLGGFVQAGQKAIVGERGAELFIPRQSGMVKSNRFVTAMITLAAALRSMPAVAAPISAASSVSSSSITQNYHLNVQTGAPVEPIVSDFRSLQSMAGAV